MLCPSGRARAEDDWEKPISRGGRFPKQAFHYLPEQDVYQCPAGNELYPEWRSVDRYGRRYRRYRATTCNSCRLLDRCTASSNGRALKRYVGEEFREMMAAVLNHPAARTKYRRRKAIIEPCCAELRERQGLKRFHRRGLKAVRAEFALHCIAFNLKKAVLKCLIILWFRLTQVGWRLIFFASHQSGPSQPKKLVYRQTHTFGGLVGKRAPLEFQDSRSLSATSPSLLGDPPTDVRNTRVHGRFRNAKLQAFYWSAGTHQGQP